MGELSRNGRDKLTFIISDKITAFGGWIEQLIAESSGKEGVGILPVVDEALLETENYSDDRLFVYLKFSDDDKYNRKVAALVESGFPLVQINLQNEYNLGGEFFRWEMATVIAGYFLHINPFDQPNVEAAKVLARKMVAEYQEKGTLPELKPSMQTDDFAIFTNSPVNGLDEVLEEFFSNIKSGDVNGKGRSYVTIQAFLQPSAEMDEALQKLRTIIQSKFRLATTLGYGPRFLHSTGQLHKGDAGYGLFVQLTASHSKDANIPDKAGEDTSSMTFGVLVLAQALGDSQALLNEHRSVIRLHLIQNQISSINKIAESIR